MKRQNTYPVARRLVLCTGLILLFLTMDNRVQAQYVVSAKAGFIQFTAGEVFLDGNQLYLAGGDGFQMENGQSLRTGRGYAELLLNANAYLRLGTQSLLQMHQNRLDDAQLALKQGSALVEVVEKTKGSQIRIKLAEASVELRKHGLYRFDADTGKIRVYGGEARVAMKSLKAKIKKGRMIRLDEDLKPSKFDTKALDTLHQWAALRSFTLFAEISAYRAQQHWVPISQGWLMNYDFGMSFHSEKFYDDWMRRRRQQSALESAAAAARARQEAAAQAAARAAQAAEAMKQARRISPQP